MSHFTVMVIGEDVEGQLAPYHEYECTGTNDQYVQDVDITEKARDEHAKDTKHVYTDPSGVNHDAYDDRFYRVPTPEEAKQIGPMAGTGGGRGLSWSSRDWGDGKGYSTKIHECPEGWTENKIPTDESFREFVDGWYGIKATFDEGATISIDDASKYGYLIQNKAGKVLKVFDRTNPNAKWDWWLVGGRWTGFFKMKSGNQGFVGKPGVMTDAPEMGYADSALKKQIDLEGIRSEKGAKAADQWDTIRSIVGDAITGHVSWQKMREEIHAGDMEGARKAYNGQLSVERLSKSKETRMFMHVEDFCCTKQEYVDKARRQAISTFAVVRDGKWYEKGDMGWWGAVADEKDEEVWLSEFNALLDGLSDDTRLTVVDCHI